MYGEGQTDYSFEPLVVIDQNGEALGRIHSGDGAIFCCRRGEREIQLTEAFTDPVLIISHDLTTFRSILSSLPFITKNSKTFRSPLLLRR